MSEPIPYEFSTSHYFNCGLIVYVGPKYNSESFLKRVGDAVDKIVETEYGRRMFDRTGSLVVTEMSDNNEYGHKRSKVDAYADGHTVYIGPKGFANFDI